MRLKFSVRLEGMETGKRKTIEGAKKVLWLSMNKMSELAKRNAPVDIGILRRSINLYPIIPNAIRYILADGVEYGVDVEYGSSPHYVPIEPLKGWAKRVLHDENAAYAVRAKIAKFGTNASPFMRPALSQVENYWAAYYWKRVFAQA